MRHHTVIENDWITLSDGHRLAARLWLPDSASVTPAPAVLEYLPYRKRDGTAQRDECTYSDFAEAGIVGVRIDIAGCGESDGLFDDEYSEQELGDGEEVIAWIARQHWCNGSVGIMGISWGGFNALQLAERKPPALKATISLSSTVDRYNDDIHYKYGCQLYSNFHWANVMLCFTSRPPDPLLRDDWKDVWINRLENIPWLLPLWLSHQRRDSYWRHGSIIDSIETFDTPTMIIGGWADLYVNAPPSLLYQAPGEHKAIVGPWIHKYPHIALPRPRMDYTAMAIDWWKYWLTDRSDTSDERVESWPDYQAFINEASRPAARREEEQGRWIAVDKTYTPNHLSFYPDTRGALANEPLMLNTDEGQVLVSINSPQDCGTACGEVFAMTSDAAEMPADQRIDDAFSLVFESPILTEPLDVFGRAVFHCRVSIDKPLGNLAVRLIDVHPDGVSHRVSLGVLNLAHRHSSEEPQAMTPDKAEDVTIHLNECGYRFLTGHRFRLSISTSYWPYILPPPESVTASIELGSETRLELPQLNSSTVGELSAPANPDPLPPYKVITPPRDERIIERDLQSGFTHYLAVSDTGEEENPEHHLRTRHLREECWSIKSDDPLSAVASGTHTWWSRREDWHIKTVAKTAMRCDKKNFYVEAELRAYVDDEEIFVRHWDTTVPRDYG